MALSEADVKTYYQAILQREPTDAQLAVAMATGTADSLISALIGSSEAQDFVYPLIQVYQAVFGRVPDAAGLDFWVDAYRAGTSLETITEGFVASDEFQTKYGGVTDGSDPAFIQSLYLNVLGRPGEAAGIAFWTSQTGISPAEVVRLFATDVEFTNKAAAPIADFLTDAANGVEGAYEDSLFKDGTDGLPFELTAGSDTGSAFTGTAGNDVYEAGVVQDGAGNLVNTLQSIDQLNGGEGTDTLNATLNGGTATPSLTSIEVVNVRATAASELNLSASTGTTNVNVKGSSAVATLTSVGNAAIGVANQNVGIDINGSTATALALNLDTVGTKATDITIDLGSATANAATSFAITANNAHVTFTETTAGAATTSASVIATGSNEITFAAADLASLATLSVTGAGSVDFTGAPMTGLKSLTAADGGVKVDATGGVLQTATTGAGNDTITTAGAAIKSISTGAGNDTVVATSALAATSVVDLGAGNDTLTLNAAFAAGATLSGGEGTDTIGLSQADYATVAAYAAADLAKVTGFEVLAINDVLLGGASIDVSKIAGITSFTASQGVTTAAAASVINLGADSTVTIAGNSANDGSLALSLKADTAADVVNLVLNQDYTDNNNTTVDAVARSYTVTASTVETLNINSTGNMATITPVEGYKADLVTNTLDLTGSNALTAINVTGNHALSLASTAAMTALATVDASANTGGLTFSGALAAAAAPAMTITGSATAANTITGTAKGDAITGGSAADLLTGGAGADTLTGGEGNDVFSYLFANDSTLLNLDVITDFQANTFGNGAGGAAGTGAGAAASRNGDVLQFDVGAAIQAVGVVAGVQSNAADAQTFLQNLAADATPNQFGAALDSSTGRLYLDWDANGTVDSVIQLTGVTTIDAAAFVLV